MKISVPFVFVVCSLFCGVAGAQQEPVQEASGIETVALTSLTRDETFFDKSVSFQVRKRQFPNPNGMVIQVDIVNPADSELRTIFLLDTLKFWIRGRGQSWHNLPPVPSRLPVPSTQAVQTPRIEEKLHTPFKVLSVQMNGRELNEKEINSETTVIPPHGRWSARVGIDRIGTLVEKGGANTHGPTYRIVPLPPGIYELKVMLNLFHKSNLVTLNSGDMTTWSWRKAEVDYTELAEKK